MRKIIRLWLPVLLLAATPLALCAEKVSELKKPTGYVDDYAGVFSAHAKAQMDSLCAELHGETKARVFVVTINSLEGSSIDEFANELFHSWRIGEKKLTAVRFCCLQSKNTSTDMKSGHGLEGILNDAKVGDFGRAMVPDLRARNYNDAAQLGLREIGQVIADDAHVTISGLQPARAAADTQTALTQPVDTVPAEQSTWTGKLFSPMFFFFLPFGIVILFVALIIFIARRSARNRTSGYSSSSDSFMSSSSSSDSSSSSSSDNFSGGGGGDSGGGGASGDW